MSVACGRQCPFGRRADFSTFRSPPRGFIFFVFFVLFLFVLFVCVFSLFPGPNTEEADLGPHTQYTYEYDTYWYINTHMYIQMSTDFCQSSFMSAFMVFSFSLDLHSTTNIIATSYPHTRYQSVSFSITGGGRRQQRVATYVYSRPSRQQVGNLSSGQ